MLYKELNLFSDQPSRLLPQHSLLALAFLLHSISRPVKLRPEYRPQLQSFLALAPLHHSISRPVKLRPADRPQLHNFLKLAPLVHSIIGKGHSNSQDSTPPSTMVADRKQFTYRPTITPNKTCSANIYGRITRMVGHLLKQTNCKRNLVHSGKQAAYKLFGTKSSLSSFKRAPRPLLRQDSSYGNWQHHNGVRHKQGRGYEVGSTVCPTVENLDLMYQKTSNSQSPTHSRLAERGSRRAIQARPEPSNRSGLSFQRLFKQYAAGGTLPPFVSPVPDPLASAVDALSLPWEDLDVYAFPPAAILGKVVKLQDSPCKRIIKRLARDACLCMGELPAPPARPAPHFVFLITL